MIASKMGNKSSIECLAFYTANKINLQLETILEQAIEALAASPDGSTNEAVPDGGTPEREAQLTASANGKPSRASR